MTIHKEVRLVTLLCLVLRVKVQNSYLKHLVLFNSGWRVVKIMPQVVPVLVDNGALEEE